jgi:hypothetical protein
MRQMILIAATDVAKAMSVKKERKERKKKTPASILQHSNTPSLRHSVQPEFEDEDDDEYEAPPERTTR